MRARLHCLTCLLLLMFAAPPVLAGGGQPDEPLFHVTRLPMPFTAYEINNRGQVVGTFNNTAAVWTETTFTTLAGIAPGSTGEAINDRGDIAGVWNNRPYIYSAGGVFTDTGVAVGNYPAITGLNNADQLTGYSSTPGGAQGFVYANGNTQTIPSLPNGRGSQPYAINNLGQIAGTATLLTGDPSALDIHAFRYQDGRIVDLGVLPGAVSSAAYDINDHGMAAGMSGSQSAGVADYRPVLFSNGQLIDVGVSTEGVAQLLALNDNGWAVGSGDYLADGVVNFHANLYANGRYYDLNTLLDDPGWYLERAFDINDAGQILAFGCYQGQGCGYLKLDFVSNVPEPSRGLMLAGGLLGLVAWRRRGWAGRRLTPCAARPPAAPPAGATAG